MPYFTIVIPTHNRCAFLAQTVASVKAQTFQDFEVIIIDNASIDGTHAFVKRLLADPRFRYIRSKKNKERAWSRNQGINAASGLYLTFLDSDDFMYPDCLNDAFHFSQTDKQIKVFHNLYELVDGNRNIVYRFRFPSLSNQYKALASGNFLSCIGVFLHHSVYSTVRFNVDPKMIGAEDYEIWFGILARYELGRIERINSGIREHPSRSVYSGLNLNLKYQEEQIIKKICESDELKNVYSRFVPRIRANFALHRSLASKDAGNRKMMWRDFRDSILADPTNLASRRTISVLYNLIKSHTQDWRAI